MNRMARIGVWLDLTAAEKRWKYGLNVFELYIEEILGHSGVPFARLGTLTELKRNRPDILLVALSGEDDETLDALLAYVQEGGIMISYAGLNRLASRMHCVEVRGPAIGYARLPDIFRQITEHPLRSLLNKPWIPLTRSSAVRESGSLHADTPIGERMGAAFLELQWGAGKLIRWNINIPYSVVGMQQGTIPVVEDGIPALDGTGSLDEGILKADDRCELDWELDRLATDTGIPYYAWPYADLWREVLISQVLREALGRKLMVPFIDYWPEGVQQVAMISLDSDVNLDESAEAALQVLEDCGIRSTWCMIEPGYSSRIYNLIRTAGHELAFHFNALEKEGGVWSKAEFDRQLAYVRQSTGEPIVSNKNHYTRYEGWGELFEWCEANSIRADQTRGPSKKGNIGFLFGTCHPYYPIAWADQYNRMYSVLEIGFLTQDLNHPMLADTSVIQPFLTQVQSVRGVAHFLFHQVHIYEQPAVADALREVVRAAKAMGFEFWTSEEILRWETARRQITWNVSVTGEVGLEHMSPGTVVWIPLDEEEQAAEHTAVFRYGLQCKRMNFE